MHQVHQWTEDILESEREEIPSTGAAWPPILAMVSLLMHMQPTTK